MEYTDHDINGKATARVHYGKFGQEIYLVDDEGNELAKVSLCKGVDFSYFYDKISKECKDNEPKTGGK